MLIAVILLPLSLSYAYTEHKAEFLFQATKLEMRGNLMGTERTQCQGCGKFSGLDDIVHNALEQGIHNVDFSTSSFGEKEVILVLTIHQSLMS